MITPAIVNNTTSVSNSEYYSKNNKYANYEFLNNVAIPEVSSRSYMTKDV